ncbi:hypothetical protein Tco_0547512 [Tanacetum coccineum]
MFRNTISGEWSIPSIFQSRIEAVLCDGHQRSYPSGLGGVGGFRGTRGYGSVAGPRRIREGSWNDEEGNGYQALVLGSLRIARNRVGVILAAGLKDKVVQVTRRGDRIMAISIVIDGETVNVRQRQRRAGTERPRILWKNLNGDAVETFRATVSEKLSTLGEDLSASDADQMWNTLARCIKDAAKDSVGVTRESSRTHSSHRESWWFSEEVQTKIAAKQARFRELLLCHEGNQEDRAMAKERYKVAKREAKIAVAQAKDKAYEDLYKKLDSKEGANDIYRIAKARERKRRDLGNIRYIKDEEGRTIEEDIRKRWGEYFSSLFNERRPEGSVELLGHTMKLWKRLIERRLRRETRVSENQFGIIINAKEVPTEANSTFSKTLWEKYRGKTKNMHIGFSRSRKGYDSVH